MKKYLLIVIILLTIFLDAFNLGLIYPIFTSLIFEGNGNLVSLDSSELYKNVVFGLLISAFPFGQFLGAPLIGQLSDHYGRRKLLLFSLMGNVFALWICAFGTLFSSFFVLFVGRLTGGFMAGNMTLAYASLADFSLQEEKVKHFALIPLVIGLGFAFGPYLAGVLVNPYLSFVFASFFSLANLIFVFWKFPETSIFKKKTDPFKSFIHLKKAFQKPLLRIYFLVLFLMISSNLLFVQFIGPFAVSRFHIEAKEIGYLYANIGLSIFLGHLFLTRRLADYFSSEINLMVSLLFLGSMLICLLFLKGIVFCHILTFFIMLACAVAYANSMALVSNKAAKEEQGEVMGIAVSIQSCSEFLPVLILSSIASFSQAIPLLVAAICAIFSFFILIFIKRKQVIEKFSQ